MLPFPAGLFRTTGYPNWNPRDKTSNIVLSNGNTTVSAASNANNGEVVRGTVGHNSGKRYFEFTMGAAFGATVPGNAGCGIGICTLVAVLADASNTGALIGYVASAINLMAADGAAVWNWTPPNDTISTVNNNSSGGIGIFNRSLVSGDVFGVAVDCTGHNVWFKNWNQTGTAGQWNMNLGGDPVAGTGGLSYDGELTSYTVFPFVAGGHGITGTFGTFNGGLSSWGGTIPTGYTGWVL